MNRQDDGQGEERDCEKDDGLTFCNLKQYIT